MNPICVPCQRFYRLRITGYNFTEGKPVNNNVPAGNKLPNRWLPYKVWSGDLWMCEGCGSCIIVSTARHPIIDDCEADFGKVRRALKADQFQVNDR